jgi:spermidine/putrescine transport system ATP-binding protein
VNLFNVRRDQRSKDVCIEDIDRTNSLPSQWLPASDQNQLLMVRPEHVMFLQPDESADFVVDGIINAEYMLGSRTQYEVMTPTGKQVSVERSSSGSIYHENSQVRLGFKLDHCHVIAESGG